MTTITRTTRSTTLQFDAVRVHIEHSAGRLAIRLRPADVPPGASEGPRVALEFAPDDAIAFADALAELAMIAKKAAFDYAAVTEQRAQQVAA